MTNLMFMGIITACVIFILINSIVIAGPRQIKLITFLGRPYKAIENVPGKIIQKGTFKLIDLLPGEIKGWNIHFFLWPFCKVYKYKFTYTKLKKIGETEEGDTVIWSSETTRECVVSRKGISNYVEYRVEYPMITTSLDTKEMATIDVFTTVVLECIDIVNMLYGIDDWLNLTMGSLGGALRGLVAKKQLNKLNALSSEDAPEFNETMSKANEDSVPPATPHPGLKTFGVKLVKSVFKDFNPADENAKTLMTSYTNVKREEQIGKATLERQKGETAAFVLKTDAEIDQSKKRLVETGRLKVDADGKVLELVPDPDKKIVYDNIGKLSDLKGTIVFGNNDITKMMNIESKGGEE